MLAAAATESRAFPTFAYDPSAGPNWATRFDLADNPQLADDWPVHRFDYEDNALQRQAEDVTFTYVDFAACDRRYSHHCQTGPQAEWREQMVPASEYLKLPPDTNGGRQPYVLTIGADDQLRRTVVDEKIIEAARRCNDAWRRLQELAGINNSHATQLLAQARAAWEAEHVPQAPAVPEGETIATPLAAATAPAAEVAQVVAQVAAEAPETIEEAEEAGGGDGLWIETSRCTTCNECTQINNHIFAYNENMQAFVADPDGGTYREIVEAAESCQVSIIHPGKPRNLNEPNLEDLISRAESFN
jgi:ferredoxin